MDSLALTQIDHFNGVVAERANEQSFAGRIEREMVDPSFDASTMESFVLISAALRSVQRPWPMPAQQTRDATETVLLDKGCAQFCNGELTSCKPATKDAFLSASAKSLARPRPQ